MARIAPGNTPKFAYIVLIALAASFLFLDLQYKTFNSTKNIFNSALLSSNLAIKSLIFQPIKNFYNLTNSKLDLIQSNDALKNELENAKIENFLILNKDNLFKNNNGLTAYIKSSAIDSYNEIASISSFDTNLYKCCDSHKLFLFNNITPFKVGGVVINSEGLLGQIANSNQQVSEVILLSDIQHSIPIKSNNFFCNAAGAGRPQIIQCKYDKSLWPEPLNLGDKFYSSGLGGIFPEGILLGSIILITASDEAEASIEIKTNASPLIQNHVMVLYPNDFN